MNLFNDIDKIKRYYEHILEHMPGHIYWKDIHGIIQGCNALQAKSVGLKNAQAMIGLTAYDTLPKEQADKITAIDNQVINSGKPVEIEEVSRIDTGEDRYYLSQKVPLFDDGQIVIGVLGISVDITAEKEAEKLRAQKQEAEKYHLKQAAGIIAHDLRTPLASIRNIVVGIRETLDTLIDGYKIAQENGLPVKPLRKQKLNLLADALNAELRQVDYANHYIDLILGNLNYDNIRTDTYYSFKIKATLQEIIDTYPFDSQEKQILHYQAEEDFQVWGNPLYLKNAINNLIKNALYFIKECRKGEIFIWTEQGETFNTLHFKDTAKGAPPQVCEQMFDGFYSKRPGGTGLGLAYAKAILESFGGRIEAKSQEGEYMHFILFFPAQAAAGVS